MSPTNQPSNFILHSDLATIASTYSARLLELIYRHIRQMMPKDDDINNTIDKIMKDPPPTLGAPSPHTATEPTNTNATSGARHSADRTSRHVGNGGSTLAVSSGVSSQYLSPPSFSGNSHNPQDHTSNNGTTTSESDRPSSPSSTDGLVSTTPSTSSSPVIAPSEPRNLATEIGTGDNAARSNQATISHPATLFDAVSQTYKKRKDIERRRYCQHIRYRYEQVDRRLDTTFEDAELKGLDGELNSQVAWAETKLEEMLTDTR